MHNPEEDEEKSWRTNREMARGGRRFGLPEDKPFVGSRLARERGRKPQGAGGVAREDSTW